MQNILLVIHLIVALLMIVSVLMQRSEGGGLGIGGGGSGGNAKPAAQGGLDGLQKLTWALGISFFATSLILVIYATQQSGSSLLDSLDGLDAGAAIEETVEVPADPNAIPADPTQN